MHGERSSNAWRRKYWRGGKSEEKMETTENTELLRSARIMPGVLKRIAFPRNDEIIKK